MSPSESRASAKSDKLIAPMDPTSPDRKTPERIGRYVDLHVLGRGGMGVVYRGYDPELDRAVAIKVVLHSTEDFVARFRREAQAVARLTHTNVVQVFDFGVDDEGNPYFVMELVAGTPLDEMLREHGALSVLQTIHIARQAALGLAAAHRAGIIHRDVKPSNLIVDSRGDVKLVDFGIARASSGAQLTQAASLMGTPGYMAPEQARGVAVDSRADIYALGLTMFEMLTGSAPFVADDPIALVVMNMQEPLPDLRQRGTFPPDLVLLIEQMAAKSPDARPQSCDAVARALEALSADARTSSQMPALPSSMGSRGSVIDPISPSVPPTNVYHVPGAQPKSRVPLFIGTAAATAGIGVALFLVLAGKHAPLPDAKPLPIAHDPQPLPAAVKPDQQKTTEWAARPVDRSGPLKMAVLKFKNVSGDAKLDALAAGIPETAVTSLATRMRGRLAILERGDLESDIAEIDHGKDEHFDKTTMPQLGKLEGVDIAVQGSVQKSGTLLRANARFVRVATGEVLDVVQLDGKARDLFQAQDELAAQLAQHVAKLVDLERPTQGPK